MDVPRYLHPDRYKDIATRLVEHGQSFSCHETIGFDARGRGISTAQSRACAGAMIWLQHQHRPNQLMQVMERLGAWDPSVLDLSAPVYTTRRGFERGSESEELVITSEEADHD